MSFSVSNGKIIGPNGQPFIAKGTAVYDDVDLPSAVNAFTTTLPGINFIRMTNFNLSEDTVAYLTPYINQLTSEGIAVEIQDTNYPNVFTGSALTSAEQWYASFATAFENNPYVWFDTQNEPTGGDVTDDQNEIVGIYNAIRATGNNNIIMMDPGGNTIPGMNPAVFATMTNVAWDEHYYNWESGYSTSLAANEAKLSSDIATMQSITSANGTIPVIVGEYGNSTDGSNVDPGGSQTLQAVQDSVTSGQTSGAISWEWYNSGTQADNMVNSVTGGSASLSSYGQEVAQWIASATGPSGGGTTSKPSPSPSGTTIKSASAAPIIDQNGNAWSLVQSASSGLQIAVNGTVDAPTANVVLLETLKGAMVQENSSGNWYSETTPNDSWTQITDPNPTSSPSGTSITSASASPIIDQNGNAWSLVQSASNGLQIAVSGTVDAPTANVVLLETLNGAMDQENSAGNWYSETTPNDSWTQIANPNPAPVVSTITTSPGSGDLTVGATVTLTVTFNSAVTVAGGTPTLALNDGGVATYVSGSGSSALVFKYTVAAGQNIADLTSAASSAITLNGATIRGTSGSNAVLTGANGYNPAGILQIDTTAPTLSAIAESPGSGQVATGGTVTLTATFSEAVTVAGGTPTLALNDGGTATYLSGSGSSALAFKYTVAAGQSTTDLKLAASNAVALNGGTIRDAAGNNAVLTGANGYTPAGTLAINPPPHDQRLPHRARLGDVQGRSRERLLTRQFAECYREREGYSWWRRHLCDGLFQRHRSRPGRRGHGLVHMEPDQLAARCAKRIGCDVCWHTHGEPLADRNVRRERRYLRAVHRERAQGHSRLREGQCRLRWSPAGRPDGRERHGDGARCRWQQYVHCRLWQLGRDSRRREGCVCLPHHERPAHAGGLLAREGRYADH